jgi:hypothetical protein
MARYQQADPAAVAALVEGLSPQIYRFFASQLGSKADAEDMLQDTWLRIHRLRHTYRAGDPALPWVYTIARRVRVDNYRKRYRISSREMGVDVLPEFPVHNGETNMLPSFEELVAEVVQHWVGAAFLQNATLDGVLPRLRNYNNRSRYMMPEIIASRLTDHHGDVFQVYRRLVEKAILSGVFDLDLRAVYQTEEPGRLATDHALFDLGLFVGLGIHEIALVLIGVEKLKCGPIYGYFFKLEIGAKAVFPKCCSGKILQA